MSIHTNYPKIDLHMHSTFSDGTFTPEELIREARLRKMDLIALTDHNTLAGAERFRQAAMAAGLQALPGLEITSSYSMTDPHEPEIHVLGYFPMEADLTDPKFSPLHDLIRRFAGNKVIQNEQIINNIAADHPQLSVVEFYEFIRTIKSDSNYNRVHIANYLCHKGLTENVKDAFDRFIGDDCKYYVTKEKISVAEAAEAIHAANGICIIAHPPEYHFAPEKLAGFFRYCADLNVDGIEVFHPSADEKQVTAILQHMEQISRDFLISTGSDFHGANKVNVMGEGFFYDIRESRHFSTYKASCNAIYSRLMDISSIK